MICNFCKSENLYVKEQDDKTGLYCRDCGRWLKWVDQSEKAKLQMEIEKRKREIRVDGANLEIVKEKYRTYKKKYESLSDELRFYKERSSRKPTNEMEASSMYEKALKLKELTAKLAAYDEVLMTLRLK